MEWHDQLSGKIFQGIELNQNLGWKALQQRSVDGQMYKTLSLAGLMKPNTVWCGVQSMFWTMLNCNYWINQLLPIEKMLLCLFTRDGITAYCLHESMTCIEPLVNRCSFSYIYFFSSVSFSTEFSVKSFRTKLDKLRKQQMGFFKN
jgi:hypothetical protein